MLYKDGKKRFYVVKSAPSYLVHNRLTRLRQIFQDLVTKTIPLDCRTNVRFKKFNTGSHATFTIEYGYRMYKPEKLQSIITEITETSLLILNAERNLEVSQKATEKIKKEFEDYSKNKPKIEY